MQVWLHQIPGCIFLKMPCMPYLKLNFAGLFKPNIRVKYFFFSVRTRKKNVFHAVYEILQWKWRISNIKKNTTIYFNLNNLSLTKFTELLEKASKHPVLFALLINLGIAKVALLRLKIYFTIFLDYTNIDLKKLL